MKTLGTIQADTNAEVYAVATGVLPDGKPVIVNSNGTVSVVAETSVSQAVGSVVGFTSSALGYTGSTFDSSNNKVVVVYTDAGNSYYGTAVVGTVSGTSISYGTPVVFEQGQSNYISATFDSSNNKVVIAYQDASNSNYGTSIVGTVSGTSISFGTAVVFASENSTEISTAFDSNSNKVVVAYNKGNPNRGKARVGTVSGTGISFGTEAEFEAAQIGSSSTTFDSSNTKVVVGYFDKGNSNHGTAVVGTVSGTDISFGTPVVFEAASVVDTGGYSVSVTFDSNSNKVVIAYRDGGNSGHGTAIVGTVSSTAISFGTAVVFEAAGIYNPNITFDSNANKVVIAYRDTGNGDSLGTAIVGTVSNTSISFGTAVTINNVNTPDVTTTFDSTLNKVVIAYRNGSAGDGDSVVFQNASLDTNLTTENFLGFTGGDVTFVNQAVGSPQVFESANSRHISSAFDSSNNKIVITYGHDVDGSKSGKAVVGTVTGNSISFGTPVVFESAEVKYTSVVFDSSNNKFVIAYEDDDNSDYGTAIVGTVSGTTISFGSPVVFESAAVLYVTSAFDSNSNKVVIAYTDDGNSSHGTAIVGTVSGTGISFGSATAFNSGATSFSSASFDSSNNKVVISYCDQGNSSYGTAIVGTVSGTSISFGSEVVFEAAEAQQIGSTFDSSNNKVVVAYQDNGNSGYGNAVVGTVSGTGISFGTAVIFETARSNNSSVTFDTSSNKVVIAYQDAGNSNYGTFISGTVSGTSISFDTATVFEAANSDTFGATFDSNSNKVVIAYRDTGNSNYGTGIVVQTESINRPEIADGKTATIQVGGSINTQQNALTAGQQYFVQADGTIGTTAASPSVIAGTAVSATDLIVKG